MISTFNKTVESKPHSPIYTMHKYFARRPWNVFNELISHYSSPGDIVLDPFMGGGVSVVESLKLKRKAIGVDINPLSTYIVRMEVSPVDLASFESAALRLGAKLKDEICSLYSTSCARCNGAAIADWIEWDTEKRHPLRLNYYCGKCGKREKAAARGDRELADRIDREFSEVIRRRKLWFPQTPIPPGDKSDSLHKQGFQFFHELFTKRNLLGLSLLLDEINRSGSDEVRDFLRYAFSSSLKWTSRLSHLRGRIVEGWAMHAYWVYTRSLEVNVWNTFQRRINAILRGKRYSCQYLGSFCRFANDFNDLVSGLATCWLLNESSAKLPLPADSVDAIITDPPYGGNVNYGELSDFWWIWLNDGSTIVKTGEAVINRTQGKSLEEYEEILGHVFTECYRVLKPNRFLASTFNSRDVRVVASFVKAASKAGFTLQPDGVLYQKPIRPYATTFHAMQIGAFVGDFIFSFLKAGDAAVTAYERIELDDLKRGLDRLMATRSQSEVAERRMRVEAYRMLIPFLADKARVDSTGCEEAAEYFELKIRECDRNFSRLRRELVERRKRKFKRRA